MTDMQKLFVSLVLSLFSLSSMAQGDWVIQRGGCTPDLTDDASAHRAAGRRLPAINTSWDASKTYKQMVVLFYFSDVSFSMDDPQAYYNRLFNEAGFHERNGVSCVADYFREQSGGLFNLQFDIYGPVQVSSVAKPNPTVTNYGGTAMREATQLVLDANPTVDYSQYDWDGNGNIEQVIYVYAGYGGNGGEATTGYIWPNTSSFTRLETPDGKRISSYTASAELWSGSLKCGIGTICHEFSHSLGLPDVYPANGWTFSVVDEWDLMDGGNFTNRGWCPPNYSPLEKMLMGWITPTELTEPTTITNLKPASEGGTIYMVKHTDSEYLLIENRQQSGWDYGVPGRGLLVWHVDYNASAWSANTINNTRDHFRYSLVHADNRDYNAWETYLTEQQLGTYVNSPSLNSRYLSGSPYPYVEESTTNNQLTDDSTPAAQMFNENAGGSTLLGKPITNITMDSEGLVSFDFMGSTSSSLNSLRSTLNAQPSSIYDLQGRPVAAPVAGNLYLVKYSDGTVRKVMY